MSRLNLLISSAIAALVACSTGPSIPQACNDLAVAQCAQLDSCRHELVEIEYGDDATCIERRAASCNSALSSDATGQNAQYTEACAAALPGQACEDYLEGGTPDACLTHAGLGAIGDDCAFNSQCDSTFCATDATDQCGSCAPVPVIGDECEDQGCGHDLACSADKICVSWNQIGAGCDIDDPCVPGATCVIANGATSGRCIADGAAIGAACDSTAKTAPLCDPNLGLWCNTTTSACTAIEYVAAGERCGVFNGDHSVCTGATSCHGSPATCMPLADEGQACDTALGPTCMAPDHCVTDGVDTAGTCLMPDADTCAPIIDDGGLVSD